jgi:hypothetical protein
MDPTFLPYIDDAMDSIIGNQPYFSQARDAVRSAAASKMRKAVMQESYPYEQEPYLPIFKPDPSKALGKLRTRYEAKHGAGIPKTLLIKKYARGMARKTGLPKRGFRKAAKSSIKGEAMQMRTAPTPAMMKQLARKYVKKGVKGLQYAEKPISIPATSAEGLKARGLKARGLKARGLKARGLKARGIITPSIQIKGGMIMGKRAAGGFLGTAATIASIAAPIVMEGLKALGSFMSGSKDKAEGSGVAKNIRRKVVKKLYKKARATKTPPKTAQEFWDNVYGRSKKQLELTLGKTPAMKKKIKKYIKKHAKKFIGRPNVLEERMDKRAAAQSRRSSVLKSGAKAELDKLHRQQALLQQMIEEGTVKKEEIRRKEAKIGALSQKVRALEGMESKSLGGLRFSDIIAPILKASSDVPLSKEEKKSLDILAEQLETIAMHPETPITAETSHELMKEALKERAKEAEESWSGKPIIPIRPLVEEAIEEAVEEASETQPSPAEEAILEEAVEEASETQPSPAEEAILEEAVEGHGIIDTILGFVKSPAVRDFAVGTAQKVLPGLIDKLGSFTKEKLTGFLDKQKPPPTPTPAPVEKPVVPAAAGVRQDRSQVMRQPKIIHDMTMYGAPSTADSYGLSMHGAGFDGGATMVYGMAKKTPVRK